MLSLYVPILILGGLAAVFAVLSLVMGSLAGPKRWNRAKLEAYECGIEPTPQARGGGRFPVKYYLTAMLFILFDIEVVFMYPWAVVYRDLLAEHATRNLILGSMVSFLGILFAGYIYALKKKAFDWKS